MDRQEANRILNEKLKSVKDLLVECEQFANQHDLTFDSPIDSYGMGGQYVPGKWVSSSSRC